MSRIAARIISILYLSAKFIIGRYSLILIFEIGFLDSDRIFPLRNSAIKAGIIVIDRNAEAAIANVLV